MILRRRFCRRPRPEPLAGASRGGGHPVSVRVGRARRTRQRQRTLWRLLCAGVLHPGGPRVFRLDCRCEQCRLDHRRPLARPQDHRLFPRDRRRRARKYSKAPHGADAEAILESASHPRTPPRSQAMNRQGTPIFGMGRAFMHHADAQEREEERRNEKKKRKRRQSYFLMELRP